MRFHRTSRLHYTSIWRCFIALCYCLLIRTHVPHTSSPYTESLSQQFRPARRSPGCIRNTSICVSMVTVISSRTHRPQVYRSVPHASDNFFSVRLLDVRIFQKLFLYSEYKRPPLWSSGQSSWLQIRRRGFDSRHY
jgi:hypothetical protein